MINFTATALCNCMFWAVRTVKRPQYDKCFVFVYEAQWDTLPTGAVLMVELCLLKPAMSDVSVLTKVS